MIVAVWAARPVSHLLYETEATDPAIYALCALAAVGFSLLACYIPARRAGRVEAMSILREE